MMANPMKLKSGMITIPIVDWLRVKYTVLSCLNVWVFLGINNKNYSAAWDKELWDLLVNGQIKFVGQYAALIGEHEVWIANYPYASGCIQQVTATGIRLVDQCSRATALFLGHELKAARVLTNLTYTAEEQGYFFVRKHRLEGLY